MEKRWIWEFEDYPNFTYNLEKITPIIEQITFIQGSLSSLCEFTSKEKLNEKITDSLTDEILNSSAIEGEYLNRDSVRKSIAKKLGLDDEAITDHTTDGLVGILIDACSNFNDSLDIERIFKWHSTLFPLGRNSDGDKINVAQLRGDYDMVISSNKGKEKIFYEAPPYNTLVDEMIEYLNWLNNSKDTLIKAAIAQLWFLIIHPLDDGNGRISRTITENILSKIENSYYSRIYSVSKTINQKKKDYYQVLEETTGFRKKEIPLDITKWLEYFLSTLKTSLEDAKKGLQYIIEKTKFWDTFRDKELNARQIKVLNKILDMGIENFEGGLTKSKYVSMTKASTSTATNDIKQLLEFGCIKQVDGTTGRGTRYFITMK